MRLTRCDNSDLLLINSISTCFGHIYAHRQEIQLRSTAYIFLSSKRKFVFFYRTDNYRQWNAVRSPDDGHKNARNMLRYY